MTNIRDCHVSNPELQSCLINVLKELFIVVIEKHQKINNPTLKNMLKMLPTTIVVLYSPLSDVKTK